MKTSRTAVFLVAFLILSLFAGQVLAQVTWTLLDTTYVPWGTVSENTENRALLGFRIDVTAPPGPKQTECLEMLTLKSFHTKAFSVNYMKLYAEANGNKGLQVPGDALLATYDCRNYQFDINDTLKWQGIHYCMNDLPDSNLFYVAIDAHTDSVYNARPLYNGECLEVIIMPNRCVLTSTSNPDTIYNRGTNCGNGFVPDLPGCRYRLCFDTMGPQFNLHFCVPEELRCDGDTTVAQGDSVQICATNISPDIAGPITIFGKVLNNYVDSRKMFLLNSIKLYDDDSTYTDDCPDCDTSYNTAFRIPDMINTSTYSGVDADTGQWAICGWAVDSSGNIDTLCICCDSLPWKIDTRKPNIDSVSFYLSTDNNGDGKIGLGDCVTIVGWGLSNPWEPELEVDSMVADMSHFGLGFIELDDVLEHNRVFRKEICLTETCCVDTADCDVNVVTVWAWDNACNYDTLRKGICDTVDLEPPGLGDIIYEFYEDFDTTFSCIGLGDQVLISATVTKGIDIVSVTAMMDSAGIDENMQHAMPLPFRGSNVYDTIWTVTEPPINYGKDADNCSPPPTDNDHSIAITACDDVENCTTIVSAQLNRSLDTRVPRPIGFNCPDTVPCALHAQSKPGGVIQLYWDRDCDECDAWYYYVWAKDGMGGTTFDSIGSTYDKEFYYLYAMDSTFNYWNSEELPDGYYLFKVKTEDNCSNVGDFSCVVGAYADATPPHVCIAVPDSGLTFGSWFPIKAVADSESHDVDSAMLWYRLRPDIPDGLLDPGAWTRCLSYPTMCRPGGAGSYVFTDSVHCLEGVDYIGWVELLVVACDETGNCTDTTPEFYDEACVVDDDVFRLGHFWFYWDTLAPAVHLVSVNGFPSPQSACGFDVDPDTMNEVVIDVDGATAADSFELEVRGLCSGYECRIFHQDFVTMPCTIWVSVDNWPEGTQYLYINVKDYDNDKDADLQVELCVPPGPPENCIYISWPHEWMRIPCTGTSGYNCVEITAQMYDYDQCQEEMFTEVRFQWSLDTLNWETIEDVIGTGPSWSTCWDNTGLVDNGDTVYFRVIAHDEFYMADTSYLVKVFVDCEPPSVKLRVEELYYTCGNETPKIPCYPLTLKAVLRDTVIDIDRVRFFFKRHSEPDLHEHWNPIDGWADPAWSENIWMYFWEYPCCEGGDLAGAPSGGGPLQPSDCMWPNDYWDIRVAARDIAGQYMYDYDNDGFFDDSTFNQAVYDSAGITVYLDNTAPMPAISLVADPEASIYVVNPSLYLDGSGEAYAKPGHDITAEISVLPSEDTCEVMKVEWFLCFGEIDAQTSPGFGGGIQEEDSCVHIGTSTEPIHFGVTFNPLADGLLPAFELEDGWWVGRLKAVLYDSLGNSDYDYVYLYILDVTPTQAIIIAPENDSYVWGDVTLKSRALNAYEIARVCYEMRPENDSVWYPVNNGWENSCVWRSCDEDTGRFSPGAGGIPSAGYNCSSPRVVNLPADFNSQGKYKDCGMNTCGYGDDYWNTCLGPYDEGEDFIYKLVVTEPLDLTEIWLSPIHNTYSGICIDTKCPPGTGCMMASTNPHDFSHGFRDIHLEPGTYYIMVDSWPRGGPGCMNNWDLTIKGWVSEDFPLDWHTLNTVLDGNYYLRAVAMDCSNNIDEDPYTIRVTVANELPEVTVFLDSECPRECSDDTVDTNWFVGGEVLVEATVDSDIPIVRVEFYVKSIFSYPTDYIYIGSDDWATGEVFDTLWNTKTKPGYDGRFHLKARAYNAAGRYADSDPIVISVDNTKPLVDIVSINGETHPSHLDVSLYDTLVIQAEAWDTLSSAGATRCYNSGVKLLAFAVGDEAWDQGDMPLSQWNWYTDFHDGDTLIYWNVSGLTPGDYWIIVIAEDCIGNRRFDLCAIHVYDYTPPMVTIGGFYYNECHKTDYIYGYTCDDDLLWAKFEYRKIVDGDTSAWLGVAEPDYFDSIPGQRTKHCDTTRWQCDRGPCCCARNVIQWVWDASASLEEGLGISYQGRILSTDVNGNNSADYAETHAPIVNFTYENGVIVPEQGPLGSMSFEKNFQIDNMAGIVRQTSQDGDEPQMFGLYVPEDSCGNSLLECIWMQQNLNEPSYFAGSFKAKQIQEGGVGTFFSSVTKIEDEEIPQTGEGQAYTYLRSGEIMTVKVDKHLGTYDWYCTNFEPKCGEVCVKIPAGALSGHCDKHIIVWPEAMPPISIFQPTWIPIGDDEGYATYVGFTEDCDYDCGSGSGDNSDGLSAGGSSDGEDYCCFYNGRYGIIKMNYSSEVDAPAESLIVAWWDNEEWEWSTDYVFWGSPYSEGFNTEEHYVEFATGCLHGPFAVIRLQDRECEGTIVVDLYEIEPFCNGYTGPMPRFRTLINDNIQGTDHIYEESMTFKIKKPGQPYITVYDRGAGSDSCDWWAKGFGQYECGGWDPLTGILGTGWNDTMYFWTVYYNSSPPDLCPGCGFHHYFNNMNWYNCNPAPGLAEGDSFFAQVYAENWSHHSCTRTVQFSVDATEPEMWFADSVGAYVGKNPHFCIYFTDEKAGVDKNSIHIDIWGDETSSPDPNQHSYIGTLQPDQLNWVDDTTVCVDGTFEYYGGYLHIYVYGGEECMCDTCVYPQYYYYRCGIADCVGNRMDVFWQYYTVDADGPSITFRGAGWCDLPLKFEITDALSGLQYVEVFEDSSQVESIERDPHNSRYWYYTPSDGPHHVDLRAIDNLGNETVHSFDLTADCVPPVLTFIPGYVDCEDFTISFVLTDAGTGVDWDAVNLDLYYNSYYILSFTPEDIATMKSGDTVTVTVTGDDAAYLQLYNNAMLYAVVYSAKNYDASYTAGPMDLAGNYYTSASYFRGQYYADCTGPSISWKNTGVPKECDWPVLLSVTDAKSGVDEVKVYQDGVEQPAEALIYNAATEMWEYTPTTGMHTLDVVATDMVGNQTTYTFDVRDDCVGPVVSFADGYVTKNPTLQFVVSDDGSGVDWTTVNAWVTGCNEECVFQAPWIIENRNGDTVTLSGCHLDCNDGNEVELYVYSGTYKTSSGPADLAGNYAPSYYKCSFVVDAAAPVFSPSCGSINKSLRPITVGITDARSGIDWSTLEFFEDSLLLCEGLECEDTTVAIDTTKGTIEYMPPAGMRYVEIYVRDYAGNLSTCSFYTEEEELSFKNPYNYPNPFDPRETRTTIMTQATKSAYVTVKIYDFAGEHVTTLWKDKWVGTYTALYWDGRTEDGTDVADGTYLCHIKARDNNGSVKTAVIKITVLKKD